MYPNHEFATKIGIDSAKALGALSAKVDHLLDQAEGFARGGDYLGARERAHYAEGQFAAMAGLSPLGDVAVTALRGYLSMRMQYYDSLVREWQAEVEARHDAHVAREQRGVEWPHRP